MFLPLNPNPQSSLASLNERVDSQVQLLEGSTDTKAQVRVVGRPGGGGEGGESEREGERDRGREREVKEDGGGGGRESGESGRE